jgi:hypothetical protein
MGLHSIGFSYLRESHAPVRPSEGRCHSASAAAESCRRGAHAGLASHHAQDPVPSGQSLNDVGVLHGIALDGRHQDVICARSGHTCQMLREFVSLCDLRAGNTHSANHRQLRAPSLSGHSASIMEEAPMGPIRHDLRGWPSGPRQRMDVWFCGGNHRREAKCELSGSASEGTRFPSAPGPPDFSVTEDWVENRVRHAGFPRG